MRIVIITADGKWNNFNNYNIEIVADRIYTFEELHGDNHYAGGSIMPQNVKDFLGKKFVKTGYPVGSPNHEKGILKRSMINKYPKKRHKNKRIKE